MPLAKPVSPRLGSMVPPVPVMGGEGVPLLMRMPQG